MFHFSKGQNSSTFKTIFTDSLLIRPNFSFNLISHFKGIDYISGDSRFLGRQHLLYAHSSDLLYSGIRNSISILDFFEPDLTSGLDTIKTTLRYYRATKKENYLFVNHSQTVTRGFEIGIIWTSIISPGFFRNQRIDRRKLYTFCKYESKNARFQATTIYSTDRNLAGENGGVADSVQLDGLVVRDFRTVKVNIDDGNSVTKSKDMGVNLAYRYFSNKRIAAKLNYKLLYQIDKFEFTATDLQSFDKINYDSTRTDDSTFFGTLKNQASSTLSYTQGKNWLNTEAGLCFSAINYSVYFMKAKNG
ncbi:MAG: hypothetical protein IPO27_11570 [Bacteroidetes bacterium]|nr:hypothetical protein [Bacteroidota bacterium]